MAEPLDMSPLFETGAINKLKLPNRFVLPAMQRGLADDGKPTPAMAEHYRRRVLGGCGLVISESTAVDHPSSSHQPACVRMCLESFDGWRRCIDAVREAGGSIFVQLWHEGAHRPEGLDGFPTISPSGVVKPGAGHGRPASVAQLHEVRDAFVRSAAMAQELGATGIEIHAAHGYLLDQTLWAESNVRDDEYGGPDLRNRMRLPLEIVAGIRKAVGPDFPIGLRFSQWKEADYGARIVATPKELEAFVSAFRAAGVDVFHVSTRRFFEAEWPDSSRSLAGWTKLFTDAPVIAVGSVGLDRDVMQTLREQGEATPNAEAGIRELLRRFAADEFDFIAIGRSQLGDPEWVNKVREGRFAEINHFSRSAITDPVRWEQQFHDESHRRSAG